MIKKITILLILFIAIFVFTEKTYAKTTFVLKEGTLTKISNPDVLGVSSDSLDSNVSASGSSVIETVDQLLALIPTQNKLTVSLIGSKAVEAGKQEIDRLVVIEGEEGTEFESNQGLIIIRSDNIEAETDLPVIVKQEDGKIYITQNNNQTILNLLPSDARKAIEDVKKTTEGIPVKFELKESGAEIVYEYTKEEDQKLLGIIPIKTTVTTIVSAQSGEVSTESSLWFADLLKKLFV